MAEQEPDELSIAAEAAKTLGIKELLPAVYQDLLQPAAREAGKNLVVVSKAVSIALAPVAAMVWGFERVRDRIAASVAARLARENADEVRAPEAVVVGPLLQNLVFAADTPHLRDMYTELLAKAMHVPSSQLVHPSFVQVIQQLSPVESIS